MSSAEVTDLRERISGDPITVDTIGQGVIVEQLNKALEEVRRDINNPAKKKDIVREIKLSIKVVPDELGQDCVYKSSASTKLAPTKPWSGTIKNEGDKFTEEVTTQQNLFGANVSPNTVDDEEDDEEETEDDY